MEHVSTAILLRQLEGIDAWTGARRERQRAGGVAGLSPTARLEAARRLHAVERVHRALLARLDVVLAAAPSPFPDLTRPRAVLIHRQPPFVKTLTAALADLGVAVIGVLDDGADAVGVLVADQPDLAFVEDSLPTLTGWQVIAEARRFCPATSMVAQAADGDQIGDLLDAGAKAAVTHRLPPRDVAQHMLALLGARP